MWSFSTAAGDRPSNGEDRNAERRLYYVAMTRARRNLALLSMGARHPFIDNLEGPAVAHRALDGKGLDVADCRNIYRTLNPSEVDLDFAGRLADGNRALRSLDRIAAGDAVGLQQNGNRWLIVDQYGVAIGRLAKKFAPPEGATFVEGSVFAIHHTLSVGFRRGLPVPAPPGSLERRASRIGLHRLVCAVTHRVDIARHYFAIPSSLAFSPTTRRMEAGLFPTMEARQANGNLHQLQLGPRFEAANSRHDFS